MATRKKIDCGKFPSEKNCSLTLTGTEEEIVPTAVYHAVTYHGHAESPELREKIRNSMEDEKA